MNAEEFLGTAAVILFAWSATLMWASWRLHKLAKELDQERSELRQWKRLHALSRQQNTKWQ